MDVRWVLSFLKSVRFGISHNKESYVWSNMFDHPISMGVSKLYEDRR